MEQLLVTCQKNFCVWKIFVILREKTFVFWWFIISKGRNFRENDQKTRNLMPAKVSALKVYVKIIFQYWEIKLWSCYFYCFALFWCPPHLAIFCHFHFLTVYTIIYKVYFILYIECSSEWWNRELYPITFWKKKWNNFWLKNNFDIL